MHNALKMTKHVANQNQTCQKRKNDIFGIMKLNILRQHSENISVKIFCILYQNKAKVSTSFAEGQMPTFKICENKNNSNNFFIIFPIISF
jgi:hypothetical protein